MPARRRTRRSSYKYNSYKRTKRYKSLKRLFRVFTLSITGFFLLAVSYYMYVLAINIQKPFAHASKGLSYSETTYNSTQPMNIVFVKINDLKAVEAEVYEIYLLHVNPSESATVLVKVPVDYTIENYKGMGEVTLKKVYSLNSHNSSSDGLKSLFNALQTTLAVDIDGYLIFDEYTQTKLNDLEIGINSKDLPSSLRYSDYLKIKGIFDISSNSLRSDLSTLEVVRLIADIKDSALNYTYKELSINNLSNEIDVIWQEYVSYETLKKERNTIIILNSTTTPGLAGWASRYVTNLGGVITEIGNSNKIYSETYIYSNLPAENVTLNFLKNYFNVSSVRPDSEFTENVFLANRSDILLVLGEQTVVELY